MDKGVELIKALVNLIEQGSFSVNKNGAKQITALCDAAEIYVTEMEDYNRDEVESDDL